MAGENPLRALKHDPAARRATTPLPETPGWPESAMAAALGLSLAGPRRYGAHVVDDPFLNPAGRLAATPADIARALRVS